jgi:hypothetical protein
VTEQTRDPFIEQIAAELRRPVRLDPRFDERVMEALNAPEVIPLHPTRQARRPWIMRPWTLHVSPLGALATAAALVGVVTLGTSRLGTLNEPQVASGIDAGIVPVANTGEEPLVLHQFTYYQKGLKSIALVGEFNDWNADSTALNEVSEGVWTVTLRLRPGV